MKNTKTTSKFGGYGLLILAAALFVSVQCAFADTYSYNLDDFDLYIWDLTGSYSAPFLDGNLDFDLTQDEKGKFAGGGSATFSYYYEGYDFDFDMDFTITGTITQKNNLALINMSFKFKGTVEVEGETYNFTGTEKLKGTYDIGSGDFICTISGKVSIKGAGSAKFGPETFELTIPADMDGSTTLDIDIGSDPAKPTKLVGTGVITLSDGGTINFSIKGSYNPKKDLSTLTLTSIEGSKLTITIHDDDITKLSGKVLGQKLKL